ncbi:thioredoxin domain-containing protein [Luteolibacter arcticus]|uniref:Thioredoxin domain-containing protein n=1 Tax=Luteolibacter arcticus TaxID=1581411 RepID=A0ABT3GM12_9BACT|nr:thioredoxin domain-containing protein [Luteolibacter arcticus]MCW1924555.1 thioredoxin domain-containing protein [Luteolibacter arcticus]
MPNALADETSPYLLQHAHNPVNWLPWSESAFTRAKAEDKLVFLSIGYSTCHWCHVMERESFENEAIAGVMNANFICVKVDREERPDIDATYMAFVQATTGQGGWPMSVWLTPEGKPVVGGTYFPPEDRYGRAGFPRLCAEIGRLWQDDRARMEDSATKVMAHLREESAAESVLQGLPPAKVFGDFIDRCESMFDPALGGWGNAPKFPRPVVPRLLLQLADRFDGDEREAALQMTSRTLRAMAAGGMHDQLAGGFHRYSVDRYWHVPHYEKMLYDQAQLALLYLESWQAAGDDRDREVAEDIFRYVLTELLDPSGAFHAAEDADSLISASDSEKKEGAYWTWEAAEIYRLLDTRSAAIFCAAYGVEESGNSRPESDPHGELEGRNTLFRAVSMSGLAEQFDLSEAEIRAMLDQASKVLLEARGKRPLPHRDDKLITAWNGLMVGALARGGRVLGRADLIDAAKGALEFIRKELWDGEKLWRSYRGKRGDAPGFAADYSFLISGLIEMHGADGDPAWLDWASELQSALDRDHWEEDQAGYVIRTDLNGEPLLVIREDYDGAEPAPNHVAAENLLKLAVLLDEPAYATRAEAIIRAGSRTAQVQPFAVPVLLGALDLLQRGVTKIEVRGTPEPAFAEAMRRSWLPRAVWTRSPGDGDVIVCTDQVCLPPIDSTAGWIAEFSPWKME